MVHSTVELLTRFTAAWNAHDVDGLLHCMSPNAIYFSPAGRSAFGERYSGMDELRSAYTSIWHTYPNARWNNVEHFESGQNAVSKWLFTGRKLDGTEVKVNGCDLFQITSGRISVKNSFRKQIA